eukprot:GHVN01089326.1.p2 GENE.GHVN01089326.1~~GHVN01089326.1.p2  ORF type:complete len:204 (+),score=24.61 GHVN01089326.1:1091-1702(+)
MEVVELVKPVMFNSPAEDVPAVKEQARRKVSSSVVAAREQLDVIGSTPNRDSRVIFNLQGGNDLKWRYAGAVAAGHDPNIAGVSIGGLGIGESFALRASVIRAAVVGMKDDLLRCIQLEGSPAEVLQAVALGVDVVQCSFPKSAAEKGFALNFDASGFLRRGASKGTKLDPTKVRTFLKGFRSSLSCTFAPDASENVFVSKFE